ncbi:MAG TPA: glycosylase [Candidatus Coprousia avicola]|nr:glycosylase [Candidatus Coprousia avicola]
MNTWLDRAVFYEIYPQSFNDTNDDGIGDIPGIIEKLDYLQELGVNALWLNPCFVSPFGDAGYDVADYCRVAPRYGTNDDLIRLFDACHRRGMHVLLDLVPGHTSIEHPWFKESCRAGENEFTGRYVWNDNVWAPMDVRGINGVLRGISERNGAVGVNFFAFQPALNYGFAQVDQPWQSAVDSPEALATRQAMKDVMAFWLERGADGFRVDMAGSLVKNDPDQEATIALWQDMRAYLDERYPEAVLISEWGEPDKTIRAGFHMDFLLQFGTSHYMDLFRRPEHSRAVPHPFFSREGKGDASEFVATYQRNLDLTDGRGLMCIPSGNHDMERLRRYLDPEEMKMAFAFILSMPGCPFIYYGDEIGMRHLDVTSVEGGYMRTGARTPMQWDDGVNHGFSGAPADRLYIAQDPAPDAPTVAAEMADERSLWREVQRLIAMRQANPALATEGAIEFVYCEKDAYPLVYLRSERGSDGAPKAGGQRVLVALNPADRVVTCPCPYEVDEVLYTLGKEAAVCDGVLTMPGASAVFMTVR